MRYLLSAVSIAALGLAGCETLWKGQLVPCGQKSGGCPAGFDTDLGTFDDMGGSKADLGPSGPPDLSGPQPLDYYSIGFGPNNEVWVGSTDSRVVRMPYGSYTPGNPLAINNFGEYLLGIDNSPNNQLLVSSIQGRIFLINTNAPEMSTTIYKDDTGAALNGIATFSVSGAYNGWAAGSQGRLAHYDNLTGRWVPGVSGVSTNLNAVKYCGQIYGQTPEVGILAVGDGGVILRGNGDTLNTKEANADTNALYGIACSLGGAMMGLDKGGTATQQLVGFAVGANGTILRRSMLGVWSKEGSAAIPKVTLRAAHTGGLTTSDYSVLYTWVVGDNGTILLWDGFDWLSRATPLSNNARLRAVLAMSRDEAIVVGDNQTVLRYYMGSWSRL